MCSLKKIWYFTFILIVAPNLVSAKDKDTDNNNGVFSAEDQRQAQEALKQVGVVFGVTETEKPKAEEQTPPKKSMAEVADKALDLTAGFITKISEKMEQVAPKIWEIMIKQQYAKAIGDVVVPLGIIFILLLIIPASKNVRKEYKEKDDGNIALSSGFTSYGWYWFFFFLVPMCGILITGIVFFVLLSDSIKYLINPEYYAVQDLLRMLLTPGTIPK